MITINDYLDNILLDFLEYLDSDVKLCDLKDVHFDGGRIPDYNNINVQQYYLLRFAYAYAFEYKCMYECLFQNNTFGDKIAAVSIGCGTGIDYWAMVAALKKFGMKDKIIFYKGIDLVDWEYKFPYRKKDTVEFYQGNAIEVLSESDSLGFDIYFFPKSISEFSDDQIGIICNAFREKTITTNKIYILVSLRSNEFHMQGDIDKVKELAQALKSNGFITKDNVSRFTHFTDPEEKISQIDDEFHHPRDVVGTLLTLNSQCKEFKMNGKNCEPDCKDRLNRWPILKCGQAAFQVLSFERNS